MKERVWNTHTHTHTEARKYFAGWYCKIFRRSFIIFLCLSEARVVFSSLEKLALYAAASWAPAPTTRHWFLWQFLWAVLCDSRIPSLLVLWRLACNTQHYDRSYMLDATCSPIFEGMALSISLVDLCKFIFPLGVGIRVK